MILYFSRQNVKKKSLWERHRNVVRNCSGHIAPKWGNSAAQTSCSQANITVLADDIH